LLNSQATCSKKSATLIGAVATSKTPKPPQQTLRESAMMTLISKPGLLRGGVVIDSRPSRRCGAVGEQAHDTQPANGTTALMVYRWVAFLGFSSIPAL
jgi:hypothetical protein